MQRSKKLYKYDQRDSIKQLAWLFGYLQFSRRLRIHHKFKLKKENLEYSKWKTPHTHPSISEQKIEMSWKLPKSFHVYDNSKFMTRMKTKWKPPTHPMLNHNFDGCTRNGCATSGGMCARK